MNYIKQLNTFFELLVINPLDANSLSLYVVLFYINNKCNWKKEFSVANSTLMAFTSLSKGQLDRARNNLVQRGFIKYTKGENKNKAPIYTIMDLSIKNDIQNDTQDDTQDNTQLDTPGDTQPVPETILNSIPLNKQNKTKQKENNISSSCSINNNYSAEKDFEQQLQQDFIRCIGSTNLQSLSECISYLDTFPYEVISSALKKTADKGAKWNYTKTILESWKVKGITTLSGIEAEEMNFKKQKEPVKETEEERRARRLKRLEEIDEKIKRGEIK